MEELLEISSSHQAGLGEKRFAEIMDQRDPLAHLREEFVFPKLGSLLKNPPAGRENEACRYFCGNSLGLQPKETRRLLNEELDIWSSKGVNGHFDHEFNRPWVTIDETVKAKSANLVGAKPIEVAVLNSLTVNLHLLLCSFYTPTPSRYKILLERKAFPSDHFAIESQVKMHNQNPSEAVLLAAPREGEETLRMEDILELIEKEGDSIAVIMFSGVQYYTGQLFDLERITQAGHKKGCIVGFDLAHAVGNIDLKLHEWNIDFACWCSYKYLNAGPGGIAGLFVHEKHAHNFERNRLVGWWAHDKQSRFKMENQFVPLAGAAGFQQSNPCVLATVALLGSLNVFAKTSMAELRKKSLLLTAYLEALLHSHIINKFPGCLSIITPKNPEERGCQLSLLFWTDVKAIHHQLEEQGIIVDKREPDVLRIAPVPLYNSFDDVLAFVNTLAEILEKIQK